MVQQHQRDGRGAELEACAEHHFAKKEFKKALACVLQACKIKKGNNDLSGAANCALKAGLLYLQLADSDGALQCFEDAAQWHEEANDHRGHAMALSNIAEIHQQSGKHAEALPIFRDALGLFAQTNSRSEFACVLNNVAVSFHALREDQMAMEHYARAIEIRRELFDFDGTACALHNLAVVHFDRGDLEHARILLEEARELRESICDAHGLSQTTSRLGMLHEALGKIDSAVKYFEAAVLLARSVESADDEAVGLLNLASAVLTLGDAQQCLDILISAERCFEQTTSQLGLPMALCCRARALFSLGHQNDALACLERARAHFEKLDDKARVITTRLSIGVLLMQSKRYDDALDALSSVLQLQHDLAMHDEVPMTMRLLSKTYTALGDEEGAAAATRKADDFEKREAERVASASASAEQKKADEPVYIDSDWHPPAWTGSLH